MQSLGQIHRDKDSGYTVHAIAADRRTFYDMFPVIARQYALSVDQLWFWGDGASSQGATVDHIYRDPGTYEVTLRTTVAFRGGETKVITAKALIELPEWPGSHVFNKTTDLPIEPIDISGENPLTFSADVWNTGDSEVVVIPHAVVNLNPSTDASWIVFNPPIKLLLPGGDTSTFSITIDPNGVEPGSYTISLDWEQFALVPGWYVTYVEPS
jgi:PKD repeat protein